MGKIASGASSVVTLELTYTYDYFETSTVNDAWYAFEDQFDLNAVVYWLINDCPYELYWYDKTEGVACSESGTGDGTSLTVTLIFTFYVAEAYQDSDNTTVSTTGVAAAKAAKENAAAIVEKYAAYSDKEKLTAYKDEICSLVSYATDYDPASYGDIWQLVYVFDGDEDTNVVCEGYSKAFQYLCDLSTFGDEDTYCYTVSGTMSGGTGAGAHMWNIVCLDGVNYLVDVTNSDSGTVGQNGGLFLVCADEATASSEEGYSFVAGNQTITYEYDKDTLGAFPSDYLTLGTTHTHTWDEGVVTKEATCTEEGVKTYTCTGCNDTKTEAIAATGHNYEAVVTAPTCTQSGYTTYTCSSCGASYTADETEAAGHTWDEGVVTAEATCTEDGVKTYTCSVCGETKTESIDKIAHVTETRNAKAATCTEAGYTGDVVCTVCGVTVTAGTTIAATGHTAETKNAKDATCTADGYTGDEVCTVCGETVTTGEVIPATGHTTEIQSAKGATCTVAGYTGDEVCTVCGTTVATGEAIPATGHSYEAVVTQPTCTEGGYTTYTCTSCGDSYVADETKATGHTTQIQNAKAATCTEDGSTGNTVCIVCGETVTTGEVIPAGHTTEIQNAKDATCTEDGYTGDEVCTVCGETVTTGEVVPATGHTESEAVVENEVAATCTEEGSYDGVVYCTVCGEELSREAVTVPATGHTEGEAVVENEVTTTCTTDGSYDSVVYCTVCGEEISRETITVIAGHTAGETVKENEVATTCTEDGSYDEVVYCTVCGEEISRTTVTTDALGHTWDNGVVTTAATATTDGVMTYTCTVCGATKTEAIPATGTSGGGTTNISIEVNFTSDDNVTPTTPYIVINVNVRNYQWYSTSSSTAAGTLIEGATSASYTPSADAVGTTYYHCVVTTEDGTEIVSEAIPVTVTEDSTTPVPTRPTRPTTSPDYYEETGYKITTSTVTASHGTIKISDSRAYAGDTVTITVSPDDGYGLDELIVKNANTGKSIKLTQKSSTKYTFTMPAAKVTVEATFVKIEEEEETEVLGTLTKVVPTTPFTDISDSRFKDAIAYVYDDGLMNGITTTTFDPEGALTRAMVATVLYRLAGEPDVIGTSGYSDVADGLWYSDAITWATQNSIVNGYGDSTFGPNDPVTREQLATMLYRYASGNGIYVGNTFPLDGFIDGDAVRDYAKAAMEWAVANSTIVTRATATLNPGEYATRAEVAQALSTLIA